MNGVVVNGLEPVATLTLVLSNGGTVEFAVIVDTGCTGDLTLPATAIRDLELPWNGTDRATLADGSITKCEVYEAVVLWQGSPHTISVYEVDGMPLLGMALMQNCRLTMDIIPDGRFDIVQLAATQE